MFQKELCKFCSFIFICHPLSDLFVAQPHTQRKARSALHIAAVGALLLAEIGDIHRPLYLLDALGNMAGHGSPAEYLAISMTSCMKPI